MMKQQKSGAIVNVASLAGLVSPPAMASYNTTKAAVVALSETLYHELTPYGVHTTVLCPGFFKTNLTQSMRTSDPYLHKTMHKVFESAELTSPQVADACFKAVQKKQFVCNTHKVGRQASLVKRLLPGLYHKLMKDAAKKMKHKDPQFNG